MNARARPVSGSLCLVLFALGALLLLALPGRLQAQPMSLSFAQGTHCFRHILSELRLQPLKNLEQLTTNPEGTLLIVLGETEYVEPFPNLGSFVRKGGALLLATDRDCRGLLSPFRVQVVGHHVHVSATTRFAYKGSQECIFIEPGEGDPPLFENLSVNDGLSLVATNRPGYILASSDCKLPVWAKFPPGCWATDGRMSGRRQRYLPSWTDLWADSFTFARGGVWGNGRVLILSDHSVFINAMMLQSDIENFDFAYNCVNWLTEGGKRKQVLFLEEGEIQDSFEVPLKEPPLPPLPPLKALVETADKTLGELEKDNAFNRMINNAVLNITPRPDQWPRAVMVIATAVLALFGLARLSQARHRQEKGVPPPLSGLERTPSASSLVEQRHQALIREGNYWETARGLARQFFESALEARAPVDSQRAHDSPATLPPLPVRGGWWQRWRAYYQMKRLWRLAHGREPVRISFRRLRRLAAEVEKLQAMLVRDKTPQSPPDRYNTGDTRRRW